LQTNVRDCNHLPKSRLAHRARQEDTVRGAPARIKQRAIVVDVEAYAKEIDARLASASSCATRGLALFRGSLSCLGTR
jgi:hypothetical protein